MRFDHEKCSYCIIARTVVALCPRAAKVGKGGGGGGGGAVHCNIAER